jgi:hypothetical protein
MDEKSTNSLDGQIIELKAEIRRKKAQLSFLVKEQRRQKIQRFCHHQNRMKVNIDSKSQPGLFFCGDCKSFLGRGLVLYR